MRRSLRRGELSLTRAGDDPTTIVTAGQIDSSTVADLEEMLDDLPGEASVAVDLSAVSFVDSSGLRALVEAHERHRAAGGLLTLIAPSQAVTRLLEITGLTRALRIRRLPDTSVGPHP